jgi:hypothetical protein
VPPVAWFANACRLHVEIVAGSSIRSLARHWQANPVPAIAAPGKSAVLRSFRIGIRGAAHQWMQRAMAHWPAKRLASSSHVGCWR